MARWEKPPRPDVELLKEFLEANVKGFSAAYDRNMKLQHLEVESMDEATFAALMEVLQTKFPDAFA